MRKQVADRANHLWAKRFKEARIACGLSQRALGIEVGLDDFVASARINRYEVGVHRADYPMEVRLARALGVPVAYLYAQTDELAKLLIAFHRAPKSARKAALDILRSSTTE